MSKTRILAIATTVVAFAFAGQASAGGLLGGLGLNKTNGIVIAPSIGVGNILSDNNGNKVLNGVLNGNLTGILNGANIGLLSGFGDGGKDCGCKKRRH